MWSLAVGANYLHVVVVASQSTCLIIICSVCLNYLYLSQCRVFYEFLHAMKIKLCESANHQAGMQPVTHEIFFLM